MSNANLFPSDYAVVGNDVGKLITLLEMYISRLKTKRSEKLAYGSLPYEEAGQAIIRAEGRIEWLKEFEKVVSERHEFIESARPRYNLDPSEEGYLAIIEAHADLAKYAVMLKYRARIWKNA